MKSTFEFTNDLINETSPYLLQHAHNPVNWHAWNEENMAEAKKMNKPILISIGYSACHWCHVMEHESFEQQDVAKIMNDNFYCIKVDREERPDVDQVYMSAVQLITGSGGWPLNCFVLPDGRPFHGGTYFPKNNWIQVLNAVHAEFTQNRSKLEGFAQKLTAGIAANDELAFVPNFNTASENILRQIDTAVIQWSASFDKQEGGSNKSPKFPLSNNYEMLLRYAHQKQNKALMSHVNLTLEKMARGGIYDQIGGGFARYSVDALWKVPHFEKMLYDNGQLLSLYAQAFSLTKNSEYLQVIEQTSQYVLEHLTDKTSAFYSAYDADSEGVEGKYYTWNKDELKLLLKDDYDLCAEYYNLNQKGFWEHDQYILLRTGNDEAICKRFNLDKITLKRNIDRINQTLLAARKDRIAPGLDDKSLTSWNAMMIDGLTEVYRATGNKRWLDQALKTAIFLHQTQTTMHPDGLRLMHNYKAGKSTINGFLEDYAFLIKAYIGIYETTFDPSWVERAVALADYTVVHFYNGDKGFFNFTDKAQTDLIHKSIEMYDNVIPSSNSTMCRNLIWLGRFTGDQKYTATAKDMVNRVAPLFANYPSGFSNWMMAAMDLHDDNYELVGVGSKAISQLQSIQSRYLPNVLFAATLNQSTAQLFQNRFKANETLFYLCKNNACLKPETDLMIIMKEMR